MREIEFRGKDIKTGELVFGNLIQWGNRAFINYMKLSTKGTYRNKWIEVIPEIISQYTGLKDKNGKKIFEGDIIRFGNETYKIVYDDACFWISQEDRYFMELHTVFGQGDIRVIGNIHDNPELLKEADNVELKPCPFCGSEAIIRTCFENTFFRVECNHIMLRCGAMFEWFETEADAIAAWNKRVKENEE